MDEPTDDFDNLCPLCMEEMDLTDRHLRPCNCGYQICVWCWHQIIELASKDNSEGRCPACRTPYDKDKVVGSRPNCEELMDMSMEKKKSHKAKAKSQEGRKHLNNVRVVQRNLVYVVGVPLSHADEETLERREFFGQYGKILKVAVSRAGQHAHGSGATASVYVTYVKDEDAVKCIKAVDGCIFEGKLLRACFGTNKYCNSWLKYATCNNPDCLYLHDEGLDEDSYTKEEMLAKYGSKNQYFHELTKPPHRAVGPGLPPPVSETSIPPQSQHANAVHKAVVKVGTPAASSARVTSLPPAASWGLRGSPGKAVVTKAPVAGLPKKKPATSPTPLTPGSKAPAREMDEEGPGASLSLSQESCSPENSGFAIASSSEIRQPSLERDTGPPPRCDDASAKEVNSGEDRQTIVGEEVALGPAGNVHTESEAVYGSVENNNQQPSDKDPHSDDVITALERIDLGGESFLDLGATDIPSTSPLSSSVGRQRDDNIITDILSMDLNTEGAGDLTKLLQAGRTSEVKPFEDVLGSAGSRKGYGGGKQQSRFSFARQENGSGSDFTRPSVEARSFNSSFTEQYSAREPMFKSSLQCSGQASTSKSRLFAPPGFSGNCSLPPPGFPVRNINNRPQSPAARPNDFDLVDPAIMAVGRGALQNDLPVRLRTPPKPDVRQLYPSSNFDDVLGLLSHQHDFESMLKQQQHQQQQRLMNERKASFNISTVSSQYDESTPFSPSAGRGYRGSPLDGSWLGYGSNDAFSPDMKFKSTLRGNHTSTPMSSLRHGDGKSMLFGSGNPQSSLDYLSEQSFREADIQGTFV